MRIETWIEYAHEWLTDAAWYPVVIISDMLETVAFNLYEQYPYMLDYLPKLTSLSTLLLAVAVFLLCRRVRRDRSAIRGLLSEIRDIRDQVATLRNAQTATTTRISGLGNDVIEVRTRQRSIEARVGKPDTKVAAAMSRAGMRDRELVDCGFSHSEVQLLTALNAARKPRAEPRPTS
jgi:hypothetical protein